MLFFLFLWWLRSCLKVLGNHSGRVYLKRHHWPKLLPTFCILVEKVIFPRLLTGNKRKASLSQVTLRLWLQMDLIVCHSNTEGNWISPTRSVPHGVTLIFASIRCSSMCLQSWSILGEQKIFWSLPFFCLLVF